MAIAALLLLSRTFLRQLGLPHPGAQAILEATQATKSRAYELADTLADLLPNLVQPVGRPKKAAPAPAPDAAGPLSRQVLSYLYAHPGAATNTGGRRFYSDAFRHFVLELFATSNVDLETFAKAIDVPAGTLDGWQRLDRCREDDEASTGAENDAPLPEDASLQIQSVIAAWRGWSGTFEAFVGHVQRHLRILFGRSFIARILFTYNERIPRRGGRSPDEEATRDSFEVFFPDAQWIGDGMQVPVVINGERFDFNLELDVDAYSGAFVGASIRDEEDSRAVVEAFEDAVATTNAKPLALLLDNRSSNHTEEVDEAIADTVRLRSTLGRPQNKAHVEGAFGLFSQDAPPLEASADTLRELAKEILRLRVQTFGRTMNHRPRRDRNWQSRVDLHRGNKPSDEEIEAARRALDERRKKIERARENDRLREDSVVVEFLDAAFERLGIIDPERHARRAIARYGRDVVIEAIATFEGKKNAGTVPKDVDAARYILGIARNIDHVHQADAITKALIRDRLAVRDASLALLEAQRDRLLAERRPPRRTLYELIDQALRAERMIDRLFWIDATGASLTRQPSQQQPALFADIARRIHATFALRPHDRSAIERRLARIVWPVT